MRLPFLSSWNRRLVAAAAVAAVAGAGAGVLTALLTGGGGAPPLGPDKAAAAVGPNGEPQIVAPDPAVEFPEALADLPNPPSHLAVDPATGDLWFMIFTYDGVSNTLYHYSPESGSVETFAIPSSTGSELYSAIGVDLRGRVIFAEGSVVTDFDPVTGKFTQTGIGEPETARVAYSPPEGTQVLDMALDDSGLAYLSRINVPAITELDLATGRVREIPYPSSFGAAYDIELAGAILWMTSRWNVEGVSEAQTGRIDLSTGAFASTGPAMTALAATEDGRVLGIRAAAPDWRPDLVWVSEEGAEYVTYASDADRLLVTGSLGLMDYVAVGEGGHEAWVAGWGSESILRIGARPATLREYRLPVYDAQMIISCPPPDPNFPAPSPGWCSMVSRLETQVRGLAVAPDGDVYFSDATLNRIGIIHAGK
jgi:streptogramin lyase